MSRWSRKLFSSLAGGLLLVACGGGSDDSGPDGDDGPGSSERTEMAAALNAAALNAQAAGDGLGVMILQSAAAMVQGGLPVTSADVALSMSTPVAVPGARTTAPGWAIGVEMGQIQGQAPNFEVGAFEGAIVMRGGNIAYGLGLVSATPAFVGQSFGAIWEGSTAGWRATALTGFGVADSIIGGNCLSQVPGGLGVTECTPASLRAPGFIINSSQPMSFPGNTATGSRTLAFGPNRLRGAVVLVDCGQTDLC